MEDITNDLRKKRAPLDPNHTHFILVDNGSEGIYGVEIEFRARLESYISEMVETGVTEQQSK
jgi:transient receptor potential cation channel subfamily M protein 2